MKSGRERLVLYVACMSAMRKQYVKVKSFGYLRLISKWTINKWSVSGEYGWGSPASRKGQRTRNEESIANSILARGGRKAVSTARTSVSHSRRIRFRVSV
jgi:hypothetical protein